MVTSLRDASLEGAIFEERITFIQRMGKSQVIQCLDADETHADTGEHAADIARAIDFENK